MITPKSIKRFLDNCFFFLAGILFRERSGRKTLLLVRTDGLGDLVFFCRYLPSIRKAYADWRIVLVCRKESAELARALRQIDAVVGFHSLAYRGNYFYRILVLRTIRSFRPVGAAYLSYHRMQIGDEMTLLSGSTKTTAFSGNDECIHPKSRDRNNRMFGHIVEAPDHVPEEQKYRDMLEALGCEHLTAGFDDSYSVSKNGVQREGECIVIGPGGSAAIRRWMPDRISAIANMISEEYGLKTVLCGNRQERGLMSAIAANIRGPVEIVSDSSVHDVIGLLKGACLFLGNESGLLHLAASLGIPSIGILGGGHFTRYFPYGSAHIVNHKLDCYECNWNCPFPEPYCLTRISVEDVIAAVRTVLDGQGKNKEDVQRV